MHVETRYFFSFKNISRTTKNKKKTCALISNFCQELFIYKKSRIYHHILD